MYRNFAALKVYIFSQIFVAFNDMIWFACISLPFIEHYIKDSEMKDLALKLWALSYKLSNQLHVCKESDNWIK